MIQPGHVVMTASEANRTAGALQGARDEVARLSKALGAMRESPGRLYWVFLGWMAGVASATIARWIA